MTPTEIEIRELTIFLAEKVMGWRRVTLLSQLIGLDTFYIDGDGDVSVRGIREVLRHWSPTREGSPDCLAVQKACFKKVRAIEVSFNGANWFFENASIDGVEVMCESYELGWCKFARKLYEGRRA